MRLSEYTDYTLRVLMYCAAHRDRLVTIGELAEHHGLSKNHLMKVVNDLARQGLLATTRGRGGGLRLMAEPETIRIGDSQTSLLMGGCVVEKNLFEKCNGEAECISNKSCGNIYRENTFLEVSGTLADMTQGLSAAGAKFNRQSAGRNLPAVVAPPTPRRATRPGRSA